MSSYKLHFQTFLFFVSSTLVTSSLAWALGDRAPLETVAKVDLQRYLGRWYEIASFPQSFQKNCTATMAEYSLREDGDIQVRNSCRLGSPQGPLKVALGVARVVEKNSNAKFFVQFVFDSIALPIPEFLANYWIIDLPEDYSTTMIGHPSRDYLWFLSRTQSLPQSDRHRLCLKAKSLGFDLSRLQTTAQLKNEFLSQSPCAEFK